MAQQQQGAPPPYYNAPQQGYAPQPAFAGAQQQSSNVVVVSQPAQQTVVVGSCPSCGAGHISDNFTALGIILAICFFPLGVLCCFLLMEKRCDRCGATF